MYLESTKIGPEGGHEAGLELLRKMYEQHYGLPVPPIAKTPLGKPYFIDSPVHFSISHTKKRVFCVLSDLPVGIDAEEENREIRLELSDKILSASEKIRYAQAEDKRQALLRLWVLKEAEAKCTGTGLQGYPNHTDFSPDDPRVIRMNGCLVAIIQDVR